MSERKPLIVIDGVAGAGKSTVTTSLARELQLEQLYCSNIFRILAHQHSQHGDLERTRSDAAKLEASVMFARLTAPALRREEVAEIAGQLATDPVIHQLSLDLARHAYTSLPASSRGLIAEGRGLGNEVFADGEFEAGLKIFMTADLDVRIGRRKSLATPSLQEAGRRAIEARDQNDMQRQFFRLAAAPDAVVIDTTPFTARQTHEALQKLVLGRYPQLG